MSKSKRLAAHTSRRAAEESRTYPVELGGCPHCGHLTYDLLGQTQASFCPCEDCHPGGAVIRPRDSKKTPRAA